MIKDKIYANYYSTRSDRSTDIGDLASKVSHFNRNLISKHLGEISRSDLVLDLGCGYGALVRDLRYLGFQNVSGCDISHEMVQLAGQLGLDKVFESDIFSFLEKQKTESVGAILVVDVLEHLTDSELDRFCELACSKIKPGGLIITHQPNAESPFFGGIRYGDFTHERAFTRVSIEQLFLSYGFLSVASHEDKPLLYSVSSFIRRALWSLFVRPLYSFLLAIEVGKPNSKWIFSRNFLSVIKK